MADDDFPGDHREAETPVPIPNTTVKRFFANGTAVRLWESRSSPGLFFIFSPSSFFLLASFFYFDEQVGLSEEEVNGKTYKFQRYRISYF